MIGIKNTKENKMMLPINIKTPQDFAIWIRELSDHNDYSDGYVLDCILELCDKFINKEL